MQRKLVHAEATTVRRSEEPLQAAYGWLVLFTVLGLSLILAT